MSPSDEIFDNCFSPSKDSLFLRGTEQGRSSTLWCGDGTPERWARVSTWFSSWKSVLLDSSFSSWNIFFLCLPICWPYKAADLTKLLTLKVTGMFPSFWGSEKRSYRANGWCHDSFCDSACQGFDLSGRCECWWPSVGATASRDS